MDTSITIALVIAMLFVFMLPAFLRRIDRTLTHGHVHDVPATARECAEVAATSCLRPADAPRLYVAERDAADFVPPQVVRTAADSPPVLHLSKPAPRLAIIDGDVPNSVKPADGTSAERRTAHLDPASSIDPEAEVAALPLAVGQTAFLPLSTHHEPMDSHMTTSQSPATGPSMQHRTHRDLPAHLRARIADSRHASGTVAVRTGNAAVRGAGQGSAPGAARPGRPNAAPPVAGRATPAGDHDRRSTPDDPETSEKIARLRSTLPFVGLGFLATALATLITAVLVPFGVLPWAVPVLSLVLAGGCLLMVRSINLSLRRLRRTGAEAPVASRANAASSVAATSGREQSAPGVTAPASRRTPAAVSVVETDDREATVDLSAIRAVFAAGRDSERDSGPADAATEAGTEEPGAAPASTDSDESSDPAESSASTESMVSTGSGGEPVDSGASFAPAAATADDGPATRHRARTELRVTQVRERVVLSLGTDLDSERTAADSGSGAADSADVDRTRAGEAAAPAAGASTTGASRGAGRDDLLATRFAATGWNPAPVPTPTYVDAPVVDRAQPEPVVPDASSFRLEPQSAESLAERFASELGYRPELEDARPEEPSTTVRDDGPLAHGRTAIGGNRARGGVGRLDDVLARRRA